MACKTMIQLLLCPRLPSFSLVLMFQPQWSLYPSAGLYSNLELSGTPFPNNSGILSSCRSQIKCPNLREASPKYPTYRCPLSSPMSLYPTALFYFLPRTQYYRNYLILYSLSESPPQNETPKKQWPYLLTHYMTINAFSYKTSEMQSFFASQLPWKSLS